MPDNTQGLIDHLNDLGRLIVAETQAIKKVGNAAQLSWIDSLIKSETTDWYPSLRTWLHNSISAGQALPPADALISRWKTEEGYREDAGNTYALLQKLLKEKQLMTKSGKGKYVAVGVFVGLGALGFLASRKRT